MNRLAGAGIEARREQLPRATEIQPTSGHFTELNFLKWFMKDCRKILSYALISVIAEGNGEVHACCRVSCTIGIASNT